MGFSHVAAYLRRLFAAAVISVSMFTSALLIAVRPLIAADFSCASGDVTCLIAAINSANGLTGDHTITLEPGVYTLQSVDNSTDGDNGLPVIRRSIRISPSVDNLPTVIERDAGADRFRLFAVAVAGELTLDRITLQRSGGFLPGAAILNRGSALLQDSIVTNATGEAGAILNFGRLHVLRSRISDNLTGHQGGGINNQPTGDLLVENSTIAHNASADGGGIWNEGSLVMRNSSVIYNNTDCCQPGGGILNMNGSVEIMGSTIAKNKAGGALGKGGGGVANIAGGVSIINSTIRENEVMDSVGDADGGGILNDGGTLRIQNTIVAGNSVNGAVSTRPDCSGNIWSLGNNLIGDAIGCNINLRPTDLTGDPGLGALLGAGEDDAPGTAHYPVSPGSAVIDRANPAVCPSLDQLGTTRSGTCDIGAIEFQTLPELRLVRIDIMPAHKPNKINLKTTRAIDVVIFSTEDFAADTVDVGTVRFGVTGVEATPYRIIRKQINRDGRRDVVLRFKIDDTGIQCGDTSAAITGQTSVGNSFSGSGTIKTTGCKK